MHRPLLWSAALSLSLVMAAAAQPQRRNGITVAPQPQSQNGPGSNLNQRAEPAEPSILVPLPPDASIDDLFGASKMQFSLVPRGKGKALFAWGHVDTGVSVRFRAALDAAGPIDEVILTSPGGDLDEGLEVGRMIHARRLATHVIRGTRCVSSCNFMFMGGVVRYIDRGASFEVHMFSDNRYKLLLRDAFRPPPNYEAMIKRFPTVDVNVLVSAMNNFFPALQVTATTFQAAQKKVRAQNKVNLNDDDVVDIETVRELLRDFNAAHPNDEITEELVVLAVTISEDVKSVQMDSAQVAASIARYLTEMGLSLKFLTRFAEIHNDRARPLTRDELREFNVINTD